MQQAVGFRFLNSSAGLPGGFHARVAPTPLANARLIGVSPPAARLLGVQAGDYGEIERLGPLLSRPFAEQPGMAACAQEPSDWGRDLVVSGSS